MLSNDIYAIANFNSILIVKTTNTTFINILLRNLNIRDAQITITKASIIASLTNVQSILASIK